MTKYILDCDTGVDDTLAIAMACSLAGEDLIGVISTYGMAPLNYTNRNTKAVLDVLGCEEVPVLAGASNPLKKERKYSGTFHGNDGIGNTLLENNLTNVSPEFDRIHELINKYNHDELILITTGPLTTLALMMQKYPETVEKIDKIVIMGGAVTTEGNSNKFAEANVNIDPEAANYVLTSSFEKTLVPLDVTRKTLLHRDTVDHWLAQDNMKYQFFGKAVDYYLDAYKIYYPYLEGCALHDPLAVTLAFYPDLIINSLSMNLKVDLSKDFNGRTVEDLNKITKKKTTNVVLDIDVDSFQEIFLAKMPLD